MSLTYIPEDHSGGLITGAEVTSLSTSLETISLHTTLPVELWSNVFTFATAFHNFDPLAVAIGRTAEDLIAEWKRSLRIRKAIICVCRTWRSAGLHLLYEHIVITEIPQLARIVQLMEGTDQPGWWTRTIYVRCAIMLHWNTFYETHLSRLIASCPNITRFIDHVVDGELRLGLCRPLPPMILKALAAPRSVTLHTLNMGGNVGVDIELLVLLARNLSSLSLQCVYMEVTEGQPAHQCILYMPLLVYLEIHSPPGLYPHHPNLTKPRILVRPICPHVEWVIPRLRSLAMRGFSSRTAGMTSDEQQLMLKYGPNLVELDLLGEGSMPSHSPRLHLLSILETCQNLQTLALDAPLDSSSYLPHPHLSITKLILRDSSSHLAIFKSRDSLFSCLEEGFPCLKSIKLLSVVHSNPTQLGDEEPIPEEPVGERWDSWRHWVEDCKRRGIRLENLHGDVIRLRDYFIEDWDGDSQMEAILGSTEDSDDSDDEYELMSAESMDDSDSDSDSHMYYRERSDRDRHPRYRWAGLPLEYEDDSESEYEETPSVIDEAGALEIFNRTAAAVSSPVTPSEWDPLATVYFPITERHE